MKINQREITSFFFSQYFSDGLRITLGVILPSLILAQFSLLNLGLTLSLGAVCVCVVDNPGPPVYKRNAMLICNACIFIVAILTGFIRFNVYALGTEVAFLSFFFSMFTVYGTRATSVGTASLLVMIFMMDRALPPDQILIYSTEILLGGVWYMVMSLVFFGIRPYRAAQQAIAENIGDVVKFLRIKADFYLPQTDIEENYKKLVSQQIQVSQHQDIIRELLFKSRVVVRESTHASRVLVLTFVDLIDMFEQIMATHYDYDEIRKTFAGTDILEDVAHIIHKLANELDNIGYAILAHTRYSRMHDFNPDLEQLKNKIDEIGKNDTSVSNMVLKKILINLRDMNTKVTDIFKYYNSKSSAVLLSKTKGIEYSRFVTHQDYAPHIFIDNLTLKSSSFKHALRVCIACIAGFMITKSSGLPDLVNKITGRNIHFGHHSYWVLLTTIVILKPGFSLSKQRNFERLFGTIIGGLVGVVVLTFVHNRTVEVIFLMLFMLGAYSFLRVNYIIAIIFMTPYVLILFKFLGVGHLNVAEERVADTIVGSVIAFISSYLLFPSWESDLLRKNIYEVLDANICYLVKVAEGILGRTVSVTEYKLARKDVYVKSANLSAAFERMTSEPRSKQRKSKEVHKFVVLNHILSSYIATIASGITGKDLQRSKPENLKTIRRSIAVLNESSKKLGGVAIEVPADLSGSSMVPAPEKQELSTDEKLVGEQLSFIYKISNDIAKVADDIAL
jgi:uncharacterized membrane protein YccC